MPFIYERKCNVSLLESVFCHLSFHFYILDSLLDTFDSIDNRSLQETLISYTLTTICQPKTRR